jgi:PAS domain S-box-containing protein
MAGRMMKTPMDEVVTLPLDAAEVRDSENRLRLLLEHNPDIILMVDRDLRVRYCNRITPPMTREQLIGADILSFLEPDERPRMLAKYHEVWSTGRPVDIETQVSFGGGIRWFLTRLVSLPDPEGGEDGLLVVTRDITDRKRMEEDLRESEARFRTLADTLEDVLWMTDVPEGHVVLVSRAFERVWGVPPEHIYAHPRVWFDMLHPADKDRVLAHWSSVVTGKEAVFDMEYRIVRGDGQTRWIHDSGVVLRNSQGRVYRLTGVARDVTLRKQFEVDQALFQSRLNEARQLESLGVLAGGIAHDFNNLLSGILGNVNLAQLDAVDPTMRGYLDQVESLCLRAGDLCKQMLAYAGKGRIQVAAIDFGALLDEVTQLLTLSLPRNVTLWAHRDPQLPALRGDATQLRQALLNLALNAAEAFDGAAGSIRLYAGLKSLSSAELSRFHLGSELPAGTYVAVEISDDGPGMPPEILSRVFEPFFTTKFTGRGLGLAAVHGILRGHQGGIHVASNVGKGSVFTIVLPPTETPSQASVSPAPSSSVRGGEVLLADDEDVVRATLTHMLRALGFTVHGAANGREALSLFERHHERLRLALVDHTMPELAGDETVRSFQAIDPNVPVILMSGYVETELHERVRGLSLAGFLQKPFRMDKLESVLKQAIGRKNGK